MVNRRVNLRLWSRVGKEPKMRYCCIIIVFLFALSPYVHSDETYTVQFQISKPYCLLNFMETLRTNGFYGPTLFEYYKKSQFNDDENVKTVKEKFEGKT